MVGRVAGTLALVTAGGLVTAFAASADAYRTGAPAGHTGGFGEPTCETCHFPGEELRGSLMLDAPERFRPGAEYDVRVVLQDPAMRSGGFQLSARFAEGDRRGEQAGRFTAPDGTGVRVLSEAADVQYVGHTEAGVREPADGDDAVEWRVRWVAPSSHDPVVFHVAANAGNDDDSEFGDRVYVTEVRVTADQDS